MPSSALDELLQELDQAQAAGRHFTAEEVVAAVVHLEQRQAEAMCQYLWALPLECVLFYVQKSNAAAIARREGYSLRAAARQLGISHKNAGELVERARKNVLAWLLTPATG